MEQVHSSMKAAGVDVSKAWLDAAVEADTARLRVSNDAAGLAELSGWLTSRGVRRVGLEATGPYDRLVRAELAAGGFEVVVHQPMEVKLYGRLKRQLAKNDRLDAKLIAVATGGLDRRPERADPRLMALSERLTAYEQIADTAAQLKTFLESVSLADLREAVSREITRLKALKAELAEQVLAAIKAHADLLARFRLLMSLPGVGPIVAASLLIRMPELGDMQHGQPASLAGVAPYDRDTGQFAGQRRIAGGRARPRRMLYLAALSAKRCDPGLKAFAQRLEQNRKPPKRIVVAVMRKLIEAANLVLKRGTPWIPQPA